MNQNLKKPWDEERIKKEVLYMVEKTEQKTFPTHSEMKDFYGDYKLSNAVRRHGGTKYWADKLGMECKQCESEFGYEFEEFCKIELLEKYNLDSELCPVRHPYDVLVERCAKVDVKVAVPFENYGRSRYYSFNLEKREQTCDFYVFYCLLNNEINKTYIVPSIVMSGKKQFVIGTKKSFYDNYLNRWDLIKDFIEFVKGSVEKE